MKKITLLFLMLTISFSCKLSAEDIKDFTTQTPSSSQLIEALGIKPDEKAPLMRSINDRGLVLKRVAIKVHFEHDSSILNESANQVLAALGQALNSQQLSNDHFEIIGHTDSTGTASYNQMLSEQRAQSVLRYLSAHYHIPSERIEAKGKGEADLWDTDNPRSGKNRRVEIINKGN